LETQPTGDTLRRVTAMQWDVYRGARLIAFTRGPDEIAAGLAFATRGDDIL
jgi:hypothetical protein